MITLTKNHTEDMPGIVRLIITKCASVHTPNENEKRVKHQTFLFCSFPVVDTMVNNVLLLMALQ